MASERINIGTGMRKVGYAPGETDTETFNLQDLFQISTAGTYTAQCRPLASNKASCRLLNSIKISFTLLP
jgi:hypothetical protein